jgi:hypothetical protein
MCVRSTLIFIILSGLFNDAIICCDFMIPAIEERILNVGVMEMTAEERSTLRKKKPAQCHFVHQNSQTDSIESYPSVRPILALVLKVTKMC